MSGFFPLLFLCAAAVIPAAASAAPPAWKATLTPRNAGSFAALKPCEVTYSLTWKGMLDAGSVTFDFFRKPAKKKGLAIIHGRAASHGAAAAIHPYTVSFWSEIHPATLRPSFFNGLEFAGDDKETTTNTYGPAATVSIRKNESLAGKKPPYSRTAHIRSAPAHDLFTTLLFIRSQKLADGDKIVLMSVPFHTPYLVEATVAGRELHVGRPAIKLTVSVRKIHRKSGELVPYEKMKGAASLWLGDDADRLPLEFRVPAYIGDVRAVLTAVKR